MYAYTLGISYVASHTTSTGSLALSLRQTSPMTRPKMVIKNRF